MPTERWRNSETGQTYELSFADAPPDEPAPVPLRLVPEPTTNDGNPTLVRQPMSLAERIRWLVDRLKGGDKAAKPELEKLLHPEDDDV